MARPLSEEKRAAILKAATEVVAEHGISAPTAKISKRAGVAEGTLFTYFPSKDDLLNDLYIELKTELGATMARRYPASKGPKDRARHLWNRYVQWGASEPQKHHALRQLAVTEKITEKSRAIGRQCVDQLCSVLLEVASSRSGMDFNFTGSLLGAVAETTLEFVTREPDRAARHTRTGFEAFWRAIGGD